MITCLTAQNPSGVSAIQAARPGLVRRQLEAVTGALAPSAAKTGMLFSAAIIREVADFFAGWGKRCPPLVVDPVMVATSGARLLQDSAVRLLRDRLLPLAQLVTPNLDEARILADRELLDLDDLRWAARAIRDRYGCPVLVKGGHLPGPMAVDVYWDGVREILLRARRIRGLSSHGTGCTYSAAIAASLALGQPAPDAVRAAKRYITRALRRTRRVGRHTVLGHGQMGRSRAT